MKRMLARAVAEVLFFLGDQVSRPMHRFDLGWLYPVYCRLMGWSVDVQDWGGASGPWQEIIDDSQYQDEASHDTADR